MTFWQNFDHKPEKGPAEKQTPSHTIHFWVPCWFSRAYLTLLRTNMLWQCPIFPDTGSSHVFQTFQAPDDSGREHEAHTNRTLRAGARPWVLRRWDLLPMSWSMSIRKQRIRGWVGVKLCSRRVGISNQKVSEVWSRTSLSCHWAIETFHEPWCNSEMRGINGWTQKWPRQAPDQKLSKTRDALWHLVLGHADWIAHDL